MSAAKNAREPSIAWPPRFCFRATWRAVKRRRHHLNGRTARSTHPRCTLLMNLRSILVLLLVAVAALGAGAYLTIKWAEGPAVPPQQHPPSKVITIPEGSTFQQVARLLEHERLIKSRMAFVLFARFQ